MRLNGVLRLSAALLVAVATTHGSPTTASAKGTAEVRGARCMCTLRPRTLDVVRSDVEHASAVFSGEVLTIGSLTARFKVDRVWKGKLGDQVSMQRGRLNDDGTITVSSCDYVAYYPRRKYLIFAYGDPAQPMGASNCSLTGPMESATRTIELLDQLVQRQQ